MNIRHAIEKDMDKIFDMHRQILELHAAIRPDIFIPGTSKYTRSELADMFLDPEKPIWVAADDQDEILGYIVCELRSQPFSNNMVPFTSLFIDDLCVDEKSRGMQVGRQLFDFVKEEAEKMGCYEITLNVWEGNDGAKRFYEKMGCKVKESNMELILQH